MLWNVKHDSPPLSPSACEGVGHPCAFEARPGLARVCPGISGPVPWCPPLPESAFRHSWHQKRVVLALLHTLILCGVRSGNPWSLARSSCTCQRPYYTPHLRVQPFAANFGLVSRHLGRVSLFISLEDLKLKQSPLTGTLIIATLEISFPHWRGRSCHRCHLEDLAVLLTY